MGVNPTYWSAERNGRAVTLRFARPPRNFLNFAAMEELHDALAALADDQTVDIIALASALPGCFVAHADLEELVALSSGGPVSGRPSIWHKTLQLMAEIPQVVIAAVDGQAWGGGFELLLACSIVVASPRAHFAFPETALGLIPGAGGTVRATALLGPQRAAELILTSRVVDGREALELGFVQVLLDGAPFAVAFDAWLATLLTKPGAALRAAKRSIEFALHTDDRSAALRNEGRLFADLQSDSDTVARQRRALARYAVSDPQQPLHFVDLGSD